MDPSSACNNNAEKCCLPCIKNFKGIETFLRRVAFNLGNTPSQTEVKIISCVPIDVTDLQNKINTLERQLQEARNSKLCAKNKPVLTALIEPTTQNIKTDVPSECNDIKVLGMEEETAMSSKCDGSSKQRKSTVSFLFPPCSANGFLPNERPVTVTENQDAKSDGCHKNFFKRGKKNNPATKKIKPKTQWVYYAHTENIPFNNYRPSTDDTLDRCPKATSTNALRKSYLSNVVQRHFNPERVVEDFSDTSNFTSPVCKDFDKIGGHPYESDVCSCCHGQFQNIDKYIIKNESFIIDRTATNLCNQVNRDSYYDTNFYDVVPVKETATKIAKEEKSHKVLKRQVDMRCWPEKSKIKQRHNCAEVHNQSKITIKSKKHKILPAPLRDPKYVIKGNKVDQGIGSTDTSKSCYIDCGEIYSKPVTRNTEKIESMRPLFRQNAECLTLDVDRNKLFISRSIQNDINSIENRTDETLNQIKGIMMSVLAEIKTNSHINNTSNSKLKKDATMQKDLSQSNTQTCSSFIDSCTYTNSYCANPYVTTCPRQMMPQHLYCTNANKCQQMKCTQNFPLLTHTPAPQIYGCFKGSSHCSKPVQKQVTTAATNTEIDDHKNQAKETEKLIKEVYKSIAITMNLPKECSNVAIDDPKSVTNDYINGMDPKGTRSTIIKMSNRQKKDIQVTPLRVTTVNNTYNKSSVCTKFDTKLRGAKPRLHYKSHSTQTDVVAVEEFRNRTKVTATLSEHDCEDLSSNVEDGGDGDVETMENHKVKTDKKSLLKRMLRSVKMFDKKKENGTRLEQERGYQIWNEIHVSESDDYETVYSEKIKMHHPHRTQHLVSGPSHKQTRSHRRTPYMEQEYKRQWNEKLIFQENRGKRYSSERPYSIRQTPVYWQNFEVRSAMVDRYTPLQKTHKSTHRRRHKMERQTSLVNVKRKNYKLYEKVKSKVRWLKKHKLGINCCEQWKKLK